MNLRPSGYEPDELPDCSTPRQFNQQMNRKNFSFFPVAANAAPRLLSTPRQWLSYNRLTGVCQRLIKSQKPNGAPDVGLGAPQAIIMNRFLNAPNFVFFGLFCGADPL